MSIYTKSPMVSKTVTIPNSSNDAVSVEIYDNCETIILFYKADGAYSVRVYWTAEAVTSKPAGGLDLAILSFSLLQPIVLKVNTATDRPLGSKVYLSASLSSAGSGTHYLNVTQICRTET